MGIETFSVIKDALSLGYRNSRVIDDSICPGIVTLLFGTTICLITMVGIMGDIFYSHSYASLVALNFTDL